MFLHRGFVCPCSNRCSFLLHKQLALCKSHSSDTNAHTYTHSYTYTHFHSTHTLSHTFTHTHTHTHTHTNTFTASPPPSHKPTSSYASWVSPTPPASACAAPPPSAPTPPAIPPATDLDLPQLQPPPDLGAARLPLFVHSEHVGGRLLLWVAVCTLEAAEVLQAVMSS